MKPHRVVKPKLMSLPREAPLMIGNSFPSNSNSSPPVSGCYTTAEHRLDVFSARQKYSYNTRDLKPHNASSVTDGSLLPFLAKDQSADIKPRPTSRNSMPDRDFSSRHFLFDERWRNGTHNANDIRDDVLISHRSMSPLSQDFHVCRSHNLTRFAHRKELSPREPRPHFCGSEYLTSFPSVLLPANPTSVSGQLCLSQNHKYSLRMKNRAHNLFPVGANNKTQSYPDPHLGASASFVQRLTEISSLEADTVRQEKMKRLRKIQRQDS